MTSLSQLSLAVAAAGGKLAVAFLIVGLVAATFSAALETTLGTGWGWVALVAAALACVGAMLNLLTGISRTAEEPPPRPHFPQLRGVTHE